MLTLEGAGRRRNDTRSTFRVSGRLVASDKEINEKQKFFALRPVTRKRREILGWAIKGEKSGIHRGTNDF